MCFPHIHIGRCAHTQKGNRTVRSTHSLVLFQLMKRLVRCPMCRTYGSLPIRWIALNRRAHSSADMIVLMDGNNIQTAALEPPVAPGITCFSSAESRSLPVSLSLLLFSLSSVCVFVFRRFSRESPRLRLQPSRGPLCLLIHRCNRTC